MDSGVLWIFAYDKPIICWRIAAADGALNCYVAPAPSDMTTDIDLLNSSPLISLIALQLNHHNLRSPSDFPPSVCSHRRGARSAHPYRTGTPRSGQVLQAVRECLPARPG